VDPLAKLHDIQLPSPVHQYPIAIGWWLLLILVLLLLSWTIFKIIRLRQQRQVKRQALAQIKQNPQMSTAQLVALLKWSCLHYFPRASSANLYGESFTQFLRSVLPKQYQTQFTQLCAKHMNDIYRADADAMFEPSLCNATQLWLNHALPPKPAILASMQVSDLHVPQRKMGAAK
jgi:ABC-type transport system involved in Fe-S cluster assembly fused permease/ATPase subunit